MHTYRAAIAHLRVVAACCGKSCQTNRSTKLYRGVEGGGPRSAQSSSVPSTVIPIHLAARTDFVFVSSLATFDCPSLCTPFLFPLRFPCFPSLLTDLSRPHPVRLIDQRPPPRRHDERAGLVLNSGERPAKPPSSREGGIRWCDAACAVSERRDCSSRELAQQSESLLMSEEDTGQTSARPPQSCGGRSHDEETAADTADRVELGPARPRHRVSCANRMESFSRRSGQRCCRLRLQLPKLSG